MGLNDFLKNIQERINEKQKQIQFIEGNVEKYERYEKEVKIVADKYFDLLEKIQCDWSVLYNLKNYTGHKADLFKNKCLKCISYFKEMREIDMKYGEPSPPNVPAFKRLAMLYEKQGKYEEAVAICVDALNVNAWGDGMQGRLIRMIKKAGRQPSEIETVLIEKQYM